MDSYKNKNDFIQNNRQILITTCNSWLRGGIQMYLYNTLKTIDFNNVSVDIYLSFDIFDKSFLKSVLNIKNSDITFYVGNSKNNHSQIFNDIKNISNLIKQKKYDVIHVNTGILWFQAINLFIAKLFHIKSRIAHSHNAIVDSDVTKNKKMKKIVKFIYHKFLRFIINRCATNFFACSDIAGIWLYGKKKWKKSGHIQKNGILVDDYKFDSNFRNEIRCYHSIPKNSIVLGLIASFNNQKNQRFLIEIFKEFKKIEQNSYLVLIGDGENKTNIENFVQENHIKNVIFVASTSSANKYYSAFDIFVMTSFFEGLPFVAIEAQCSGIPCILSDSITREVKFSKNIEFVSLEESPKIWCEKISKLLKENNNYSRKQLSMKNAHIISSLGYDLNSSSKNIEVMYKGK